MGTTARATKPDRVIPTGAVKLYAAIIPASFGATAFAVTVPATRTPKVITPAIRNFAARLNI